MLIRQSCAKQAIGRDQLTIHADRGSSMTSKPVAFLLADLGITQSHSRPHVSNDNPFSDYAEGVVMPSADRGARVVLAGVLRSPEPFGIIRGFPGRRAGCPVAGNAWWSPQFASCDRVHAV